MFFQVYSNKIIYIFQNHMTGTGSQPIYTGSSITRGEVLLMVLSFVIRHHVSRVGLNDLLSILNVIVPGCVPPTLYFVDKLFSFAEHLQCHLYCQNCLNYINVYEKGEESICSQCQTTVNSDVNLKNGNFFIVIPLKYQLQQLLQIENIQDIFLNRMTTSNASNQGQVISDITDGVLYKQFITSTNSINLISTVFNCDGVPVFSSSNFSIWPFFHEVNELPFSIRSKHVLLHALWFGVNKPRMDAFLKPIIDEGKALYNDGFQWIENKSQVTRTTRVIFCALSCDSVARASVLNMKQFNGKFGCNFCLHEGVTVQKGRGFVRVYPLSDGIKPNRTADETVLNAEQAAITDVDVNGIKGPSMLMLLPHFDIINSVIPDYMHCVLLGVVRQFVFIWFDSSNNKYDFYLGNQQHVFDQLILGFKVPSEVLRLPRSIKLMKLWKASEWRSFLLLYSPIVLKQLLPAKFFAHWMLLVHALTLLLGHEIKQTDVLQAGLALTKFVAGVEDLYGKQYVSFNTHLLLHLSTTVRNWGPLWAHSAFVFEDRNGFLLTLFKGTNNVALQICRSFISLEMLKQIQFQGKFDVCEDVSNILQQIFCSSSRIRHIKKSINLLGTAIVRELNMSEVIAIMSCIGSRPSSKSVHSYKRFTANGSTFSSCVHDSRRNDSVCVTSDGNYGIVQSSVICTSAENNKNNNHMIVLLNKIHVLSTLSSRDNYVQANIGCHIKICEISNELFAVKPQFITGKCFMIPISESRVYIIKLPRFELD